MKHEAIDKIKSLRAFSKSIGDFFASYKKATSSDNCDKYGAQFNGDDRFNVFKITKSISFDAYTGYYGRSSCSKFGGSIANELANDYFVRALNALKEPIFEEMARLAETDAKKLCGAAQKELEGLQELLGSVADTGDDSTQSAA